MLESLLRDLRFAVRTFAKTPVFTSVAVLTLALGIGPNSAIFSVVNAVLLRPLPYPNGERLAVVWTEMTSRNVRYFPASPPNLADFRTADAFESVAGVFSFSQTITGVDEAKQVQVGGVTIDFLSTLGVQPMIGRDFVEEDGVPLRRSDPNAAPPTTAVILSHAYWQSRVGADPDVLGRGIEIGGRPAVIVGVMPPGFKLLLPPMANADTDIDLWMAARIDFANAPRENVFLIPIGLLKPGATLAQAQSQLDVVSQRISEESPTFATAGAHAWAANLHADLTSEVRPVVWALLGAVGFVLLIACVNVANLLLVRATSRAREISIRAAIGGSRSQLIRQMLVESLLLSLAGGALGLVVAYGGITVLAALRPTDLPRIDTIAIDGTVLGFTALASLVAAVLFGTLPTLQASKPNLTEALHGRSNTGGAAGQRRARSVMVVLEVAMSLVLLIGAGLMVRSFIQLTRVQPGFNAEGLLTFRAPLPGARYPQGSQRAAFQQELRTRIAGLPGVQAVSGAFPLPLDGRAFNSRYGTEEAESDPSAFGQADYRAVLPGYFEAMQTPLIEGRVFTEADNTDSLPVVIVDDVLARRTWPNESAVGKRLLIRNTASVQPQWVQVIGVVAHQRAFDLTREGRETVYFTDRYQGTFGAQGWVVRATGDPLTLVNAIRREVAAIDGDVPVAEVLLMDEYVREARAPTRFSLVLIGVFGLVALILASVGLYGVLSYVVRQRTAEIGVRMAFGAGESRIVRLVVGQGMTLALIGLGIGMVAAAALTRVMSSMLVEVTPTDPVTFGGIAVFFTVVAALACYLPARRATRVDPMVTLRQE
jgi:predicted permease